MSGYLQRLASSVLTPGGSIHPVVGSVFAGPKFGRTADTIVWEDDGLSSDNSESVTRPSAEVPRRLQAPDLASDPPVSATPPLDLTPLLPEPDKRHEDPDPIAESRSTSRPDVSEPFSAEPTPRRPDVLKPISKGSGSLLPVVSRPTSAERPPFKPLVIKATEKEIALPVVRYVSGDHEGGQIQGAIEPREEGHEQEVVRERVQRPLMPESYRGTVPASVIGDKPNLLAPARGTVEKRGSSRGGAGLAEREPDEIQIHIGRIEVTAVPPAQAPPPARSAPKSPSLSEYLKRRDTRAL